MGQGVFVVLYYGEGVLIEFFELDHFLKMRFEFD
jgi:hypothetical protein